MSPMCRTKAEMAIPSASRKPPIIAVFLSDVNLINLLATGAGE